MSNSRGSENTEDGGETHSSCVPGLSMFPVPVFPLTCPWLYPPGTSSKTFCGFRHRAGRAGPLSGSVPSRVPGSGSGGGTGGGAVAAGPERPGGSRRIPVLPAGTAAAPHPALPGPPEAAGAASPRVPSLPSVSRDSAPLLRGRPGPAMVRLHVKRGGESQFLLEAPGSARLAELTPLAARIHNGRLKVQRLCSEMEELAEHGISLPYNMQGLTDEQIEELKLKDEWAEKCVPSGGSIFRKDEMGRRNGFAPNKKMQQVIKKTIEEAKALISKKQVQANVYVNMETVKDALEQLRGAVMIVYPMGLPPHDPIRMEFEDKEDLSGTHAGTEVIKESEAQLWWAGKQLEETKLLSDYVGKNEKTTIIVKIQKKGQGAPGREPVISHEEHKEMMLYYYRKQEELKKLEEEDDDSFLNAEWADNHALKRQFHGVKDIKWGPR